jgi:hypothetical protein
MLPAQGPPGRQMVGGMPALIGAEKGPCPPGPANSKEWTHPSLVLWEYHTLIPILGYSRSWGFSSGGGLVSGYSEVRLIHSFNSSLLGIYCAGCFGRGKPGLFCQGVNILVEETIASM